MPESEVWKELVKNDFKDYELKIKELLEHPVELSVDDLKRIALSLKVYTEKSDRKKDTPLQSARSLLTFYINRTDDNITDKE